MFNVEVVYRINGVEFKIGQQVEVELENKGGLYYGEEDKFTGELEWIESESLGIKGHDIDLSEILSIKAI